MQNFKLKPTDLKINLLIVFLTIALVNAYTQQNYLSNNLDTVLLEDTVKFWGTQVEYEYYSDGELLSGQTKYQGISIYTKDSIFHFTVPYGYNGSESYKKENDTMSVEGKKYKFNIEGDIMYVRNLDKRIISTYRLMAIPSIYFIKMLESENNRDKIELSQEETEYIDSIIYYWIKDISAPVWNE
jgi:hypothetical protein